MDAQEYLEVYGEEKVKKLCDEVGTSFAYYKQICSGHRRFSVELTNKFVSCTGGELSFIELLNKKKKAA